MCEDCGVIICPECTETKSSEYFLCSECGHVLGNPSFGEKFEKCPACEAEDITTGKRLVETCPRCHSTRTVLIEERRRKLAQQMKQSIMSLQYGHTKLREFNSRLISGKRLLVSLRMANFLHYRWLEEKMEKTQDELQAVKNRVSSQAEMVAKKMAAETKNLIDYNRWTVAQFPFIEGVLNRLAQLSNQYKVNIDDSLRTLKSTLDDVSKQLDGMKYYRNQFSTFYDTTDLSVNELPVCALPNIRITGSDFLKTEKASGTLYITNRRLVFIAKTGLVRRKMEVIFDYPLIYLNRVEEDGRLRKRLVLKMKQGEIKMVCSNQTKKVMPDYVEIARKFDKYVQTDLGRVRQLEQKEINVSDVRLKIEKLVYQLLSVGDGHPTHIPQGSYCNDPRREYDPYLRHRHQEPAWRQLRPYDRPPTYRDELERRMSRDRYDRTRQDQRRRDPLLDRLQRSVSTIESEARHTVRQLRDGSIIPEDFIRRYKGLMRDSYTTKREIDQIVRSHESPRW
jgi:transposase-like protein